MTMIPQTECCTMLGIDPKTLRNWMRRSQMLFTAHPADARLKCLTTEQVQQLATLHNRPLSSPVAASTAHQEGPAVMASSQQQALPLGRATPLLQTVDPSATSLPEEAELRTSLACLETKMLAMQEQLTQLALALLREREWSVEQRLAALEAFLQPPETACPSPPSFQETTPTEITDLNVVPARRLLPAELRARSRITPLIEYGAQGFYVAVCPQEGTLQLTPDSAEWFDWLASLTSFRFVGPQGRFTAYRNTTHGQRTRGWTAHRCIHGRHYKYYLGVTDHLTLPHLEQMAAKLHSHISAL